MIQSIFDGIGEALEGAFSCTVYTEYVEQGLEKPCFFVRLVNSVNEREVGKRFRRENLFCVKYFPASEYEPGAECHRVQEELYDVLEYITIGGGLLPGLKMRGEFVDGVLNFFVNFNMRLIEAETPATMGELEVSDIKAGG